MAKALQCPSCGTKTRLDSHAAGETFSCDRCGQTLKVPPGMGGRRAGGAAAAGSPAPPRRSRPVMTAGSGVAAGGTAVLSAPAAAPVAAPPMAAAPARSTGGRETLPLWMRIGVWVIALPVALAIVGIPARAAGYLSSQKMLDVIVKRDLGRFVPLLIIVALWALVTAVLVTVLVEGGRRFMLRRRDRSGRASGGVVAPSLASPAPPPRRGRGKS